MDRLHDFPHLAEEIILRRNEEFRETRLCVVPNLFIGIELRGIARQMLDNDVAITFFNEPLQCFAAMVAGIVRDHNDRLAGICSEIFEKLHEPGTIHSSLEGGKSHISARAHRTDQSEAKAAAAVRDNRRLTDLPPGRPAMRIRANRSLIDESQAAADKLELIIQPVEIRNAGDPPSWCAPMS